jgi:hypothetical protein
VRIGFIFLLRVRLVRKFALALNGVDLSKVHLGAVVDFPDVDARMLVREGWAEVVEPDAEDVEAGKEAG